MVWTSARPASDGSAFAESYWLLPGNIPGKCGLYAGGIKMRGTQSAVDDAEVLKGYGMSPIIGLSHPETQEHSYAAPCPPPVPRDAVVSTSCGGSREPWVGLCVLRVRLCDVGTSKVITIYGILCLP